MLLSRFTYEEKPMFGQFAETLIEYLDDLYNKLRVFGSYEQLLDCSFLFLSFHKNK